MVHKMALENILVYDIVTGDTTYPHTGNFTIAVAGKLTIDDSNGTEDDFLGDFTHTGSADVSDQDVTASTVAGINPGDLIDARYGYTYVGSDGSSGAIFFLATNQLTNAGARIISFEPLDPTVTYTFEWFFTDGAVKYSEVVPCFTAGTQIQTRKGEQPIEELSVGDLVHTSGNLLQPLLWIGSRLISNDELTRNPKLRPIRILAGALGSGLPKRDLLVSRQHRILVQSKICERMFGRSEALVSAIKLTDLPGIFIDEEVTEVEYFHLLFSEHRIVYAEGAPSESLLVGSKALTAMSPAAREEIQTIFPELADPDFTPEPARYIPLDKLQVKLVERHLENEQPLLQLTHRFFLESELAACG